MKDLAGFFLLKQEGWVWNSVWRKEIWLLTTTTFRLSGNGAHWVHRIWKLLNSELETK